MATDTVKKESFWQGIAAGFLAGIAVAAALRYTPFEKFISGLSTVEGKLETQPAAPHVPVALPVTLDVASDGSHTPVPLQRPDHIDLGEALRNYPRSFDMGSAG